MNIIYKKNYFHDEIPNFEISDFWHLNYTFKV